MAQVNFSHLNLISKACKKASLVFDNKIRVNGPNLYTFVMCLCYTLSPATFESAFSADGL